jgi:hypothetical protein
MKEIKDALKNLNKPLLALIAVLGLFFIGLSGSVLYRSLAKPKVSAPRSQSLAAIVKRLDKAIESVRAHAALQARQKADNGIAASLKKDNGKGTASEGPLLKGVAKSNGKTKVFLNDQILCVGDELDGCYTVADIKKDSVTLRDKDGYESVVSLEIE